MAQQDDKREQALDDLRFLLAQPRLNAWGMDCLIDTLVILMPEVATIVEQPQR